MIDNHPGTVIRLYMADLNRDHLDKSDGKTAVNLAIVPRSGLPLGASHAVYQLIPGITGENHPIVGYARPYS